jgi:PAS domain S-box-containing protein
VSPLRLRPLFIAAAPAALILAIGGASGVALRRASRTAGEVRQTEQALRIVERVHARVADAVIDARGFALTGDSALLVGTVGWEEQVLRDVDAIDTLMRTEPTLGPRVRAFRAATLQRIALTDSMLRTARAGRTRVASPALADRVRRGSIAMDTLRAELEALEAQVQRAVADRERDDAAVRDLTLMLLVGGVLLSAVVAVAVHLTLTRLLARARAQAEEQARTSARLREQAGELATRRERLEDQALALELANEQLREQATELELQTQQLQDQTVELEAANDALRESALRDQLLFERAPLPMWLFDADTLEFLAVNDAATAHYGWSREEFLGMTIRDIRPPSDVPVVESLARDHRDGDTTRRLVRHVTRSGQQLDVLVVAHDAALGGRRVRIVTALDETARASAERARVMLERQLQQAQKMEAIGRVASGVAHDFNNLLTIVRVNLENVFEELPADSLLRLELTEAGDAVTRATTLTRQLLTIGRQQHVDRREVDLGQVVRDAERLVKRLAGDRVRVETRLAESPLVVLADVGQLEQVLMNLAVNARDAMPAGGTLTVATARRETVAPGADAPRAWAVLTVSDTGVGMDAATRDRIFEPFFTTKSAGGAVSGSGTGLGLATAFGIVEQDGGFITVDSAPGEGARFEVHLRLLNDAPAPTDATGPADPEHAPDAAPDTSSTHEAEPAHASSSVPSSREAPAFERAPSRPAGPYAGPRVAAPRPVPARGGPTPPAAPRPVSGDGRRA